MDLVGRFSTKEVWLHNSLGTMSVGGWDNGRVRGDGRRDAMDSWTAEKRAADVPMDLHVSLRWVTLLVLAVYFVANRV